jgi:hypothetical protein
MEEGSLKSSSYIYVLHKLVFIWVDFVISCVIKCKEWSAGLEVLPDLDYLICIYKQD